MSQNGVKLTLLFALATITSVGVEAREAQGGYSGVEFFGSSLISRQEVEKYLGLKAGAPITASVRAVEKLKEKLAQKNINANIDVAEEADGSYCVTVDVLDRSVEGAPIRKLAFARHVQLSSDKPFMVIDQLLARRQQLAEEGRAVTESYRGGIKYFSDEPCNQFGEQLLKQVPAMKGEFLTVVASDPDPVRRSKAIEVLNWGGDYVRVAYQLIPALDDASEQVRASVARFILPRLDLLPEDFPFADLVERFSHQLARPSYFDRLLALRCLLGLARMQPDSISAIKIFDEDKIKQLEEGTQLQSIKQPAAALLDICAHPPKKRPKPVPQTEF
jgi:hypothetical protein